MLYFIPFSEKYIFLIAAKTRLQQDYTSPILQSFEAKFFQYEKTSPSKLLNPSKI